MLRLIAHEVFRITTFILNKINVKFSLKKDEAYAYLLHYLVDEDYNTFEKMEYKIYKTKQEAEENALKHLISSYSPKTTS